MISLWDDDALGFAKATNAGIKQARTDKIVLLNNDTLILGNNWLDRLDVGDISAVLTKYSPITKSYFGVFFCVMIQKRVLDTIGLLNEQYAVGGCEDIDFCHLAELNGFKIVELKNNILSKCFINSFSTKGDTKIGITFNDFMVFCLSFSTTVIHIFLFNS